MKKVENQNQFEGFEFFNFLILFFFGVLFVGVNATFHPKANDISLLDDPWIRKVERGTIELNGTN